MRRAAVLNWIAIASMLAATHPAAAFPTYGTQIDQTCTANRWVPARPFNPNNLNPTDPKKVNCGLCHVNAASPAVKLTPNGKIFKSSGFTDVRPFCAPAASNGAPVFAAVGPKQANVGQLFRLTVSATDPDNDALSLSVSNAPAGSTFSDQGNGTGTFSWTPGMAQAGNRQVTFHATDDGAPMASATLNVAISVAAAASNRAPVFAAIGPKQANVGQLFRLTVSATDPDNDALSLSVSNAPASSTFSDQGNGTGTFSWTPGTAQAGNRQVTFHATDAGAPMASATLNVAISVGAVANRPPLLAPIGDRQVNVGATLNLTFSATDPDGNAVSFATQPLPAGASASASGFSWTPSAGQVGNRSLTVTATDSGTPALTDAETFMITVGRVNRPPLLDAIGDRTAQVGDSVRIAVIASDADGDSVALACSGLPAGATFTDLMDRTGEIVWMPVAPGQANVTCQATDSGAPPGVASEMFHLTANAVPPPPGSGPPTLSDVRWESSKNRLFLSGAVPIPAAAQEAGASDSEDEPVQRVRVEVLARLADGTDVLLGSRRADKDGALDARMSPFIAPCRVVLSSGGMLSAPMAVANASARCDEELLLEVRSARVSCSGEKLRVQGNHAPPNGTVSGADAATDQSVFSVTVRRTGSFKARELVATPPAALELSAEVSGHQWTLDAPVPVTTKRCEAERGAALLDR